ncbi:efflux RND transporter periplasmic adaptor subunit [Agaribacter marinus]|uniref:MexH family multidrug efflux RND transporter periplasmic adaptor subunit n=1 Tax=Agaribacter marinus TaxID=1431249 RepID=A0AA37WIJ9_9ALTE|nr:efflux RND transporter periplasmic adaptor subunit [Agaribacter marinus]GLR71193.1 MexH family multidrug efflux RND transporter periplasmic adaptor subunit [Agaribacter marinus]
MRRIIKISPLLLGVIVLGGFIAYMNLPQQPVASDARGGGQTPVAVKAASQESFPVVVEALGTAVANESVNITAQQAETLTEILFDDGDAVEQGQLLAQLNNRAEIAKLNEIEINLADAKRQLSRIKGLARERAASQQLLEEQQARVKALSAQREVAKAELEELKVIAPFSGRLGTRMVSVGSLVRPGDTITTLDDLRTIKVDFNVSENHLSSLADGQNIAATSVAYPGEIFSGQISNVESRIDPVTRSIRVRAKIDNEDLKLRPGLLLQVNIEKRVLNALVVPESALVPDGDKQYLYTVNGDNKAVKVEVTVGERKPGLVQILDGVSVGEKVIVEGTLRIRDGSLVKIIG